MNKLEQLRSMTTIVADTGDIEAIGQYLPTDATTNPSLILLAAEKPQYEHLIEEAVNFATHKAISSSQVEILLMNKIFVNFGAEILKIIPGRISTEIDAKYSFNVSASVEMARQIIELYESAGFPRERVLIKLTSTWEGVKACEILEKEGIHCNMTLMFSLAQAAIAAEAGATLISPFVGRILDWYKKNRQIEISDPEDDPGVKSVKQIFNYYKKFAFKTLVMGASFRNVEEPLELAGCDLLTISPKLLEEMKNQSGPLKRKLDPEKAKSSKMEKLHLDESEFRRLLNENAMATEKLAEGIRRFSADYNTLEERVKNRYLLR